ncbi:MAG TPA: ABC transporter ATP-binding protein [Candidatus Eremiobacteraceae bacterium]|nr:ABC transporter ATP-binding protein [Candidatus Eremiobacteraceae bacterium]
MPVFEVRALTKRFGKKVAVDGISFEVAGGEIVGLLGPNGAGKSTTFLCASGLLRPDTGYFAWDGRELGNARGQTVALIPETPDVYPMLTVWEHMVFVAKSCRLADGWQARAGELLERFQMTPQRDVLGSDLSKGMRQKTLVAATVLAATPVMLFDEPMVGLDPLGQRELREIIAGLRSRGIATMISTHMLAQAQTTCDRVVILKSGRIVACGTFEELQERTGSHADAEDVFLELTR